MSERILNNVNPTPEEVRVWGYDEDMYFTEQDEDLILYGTYYIPVLLELAQDPACPKQYFAYCILGQSIREAALYYRSHELQSLEHILETTTLNDEPLTEEWHQYALRLLAYERHPYAVDETAAWKMANDLLLGIGRIGTLSVDETGKDDEWHFVLATSGREHLAINKHTGVWTYQWR